MKHVSCISAVVFFLSNLALAETYNIIPVLEKLEGCKLEAYQDVSSGYHIGFGTPSHKGEQITRTEAVRRAAEHIRYVRSVISDTVQIELTHNQQVALVSFIYNIGESHWRNSTVLEVINERRLYLVPQAMKMWNKVTVNGKKRISPGLVRRREFEIKIWMGKSSDCDYVN